MFSSDFEEKINSFFESNPSSNRVGIQVSDKYVPITVEIHEWFMSIFPSKFFFIISDTSFNDCCVDHISAKHLDADAIIHFGPYCSKNYSIPVCFLPDINAVFNIDSMCLSHIENFVKAATSKNLLIIADQVELDRSIFERCCAGMNVNIIFSSSYSSGDDDTKLFDFYIPLKREDYSETSLIYIGPLEKLSMDLGCIFYNHPCLRFNSLALELFEGTISRELTKRNGLIESIRCFDHVGIVVENPNVRLHVQTSQYLQNICSANDMIADIIYVGRLNEMKLGNFADIQFFIHLSCAGRPSFSFVKPLVTPFEFLCAKFDIDFWKNQFLRDYELFLSYCDSHLDIVLPTSHHDSSLGGQLVLKNFFELSTQLVGARRNYSYNGLEINSISKEMKIHKGVVGNSTGYDYENK